MKEGRKWDGRGVETDDATLKWHKEVRRKAEPSSSASPVQRSFVSSPHPPFLLGHSDRPLTPIGAFACPLRRRCTIAARPSAAQSRSHSPFILPFQSRPGPCAAADINSRVFLTIRTAQNTHHVPLRVLPTPPLHSNCPPWVSMAGSFALFALALAACAQHAQAQTASAYDFFDYIDPLIGTVNGGVYHLKGLKVAADYAIRARIPRRHFALWDGKGCGRRYRREPRWLRQRRQRDSRIFPHGIALEPPDSIPPAHSVLSSMTQAQVVRLLWETFHFSVSQTPFSRCCTVLITRAAQAGCPGDDLNRCEFPAADRAVKRISPPCCLFLFPLLNSPQVLMAPHSLPRATLQ